MTDACEHYRDIFPDLLAQWIAEGAVVCGYFEFPLKSGAFSPGPGLSPLERAIALHGEDAVLRFIFDGPPLPPPIPLPAAGWLLLAALFLFLFLKRR
jgi:hypothetical protein